MDTTNQTDSEFTWPDGRKYIVFLYSYLILRVSIQRIRNRATASSSGLMVEVMSDNGLMANSMVRDIILIRMEKRGKDYGRMVKGLNGWMNRMIDSYLLSYYYLIYYYSNTEKHYR